jgi:hypothetical protein
MNVMMTKHEAETKAVRRWGNRAYAVGPEDDPDITRYVVGCTDPDVNGVGNSWEAAFADAMESESAN